MPKFIVWFILCAQLFCLGNARAQSKKTKPKPKTRVEKSKEPVKTDSKEKPEKSAEPSASAGQTMTVKAETAIVYNKPDFDAAAIAYLASGESVRASKKSYGEFQKFYKVRLPNGKFGYVSTIDVAATKKAPREKEKANPKKPMSQASLAKQRAALEKRELQKPMILNRWYGLLLGQMTFSEKTSIGKKKDDLLIYGLKLTGPDLLLGGLVMDVNLFFHFGAPDYYKDISRVKPTGFLMFADALAILPFVVGNDGSLYAGIGPILKYTNFKYITSGRSQKSASSYGIGGSLVAGTAYRFGAFSSRVELKYIFEKSSQTVIQIGLQTFL